MMKKVAFHTLGCKLNFSETSSIARSCEDEGYEKVNFKSNFNYNFFWLQYMPNKERQIEERV